jgi:peptidoglycan hydrolase CwlO-like protein
MEEQINKKVDDVYDSVDGFIKIVTKLKDEFELLKQDLDRMKTVIKEKLGVDLF